MPELEAEAIIFSSKLQKQRHLVSTSSIHHILTTGANMFGKYSGLPPKAPRNQLDVTNVTDSNGDQICHNESTPLIGTRKTEKRNNDSPTSGHSKLSPSYSDSKTRLQNSWTDPDRSIDGDSSITSLSSLTTAYLENFRNGLQIPFTDEKGSLENILHGLASLCILGTLLGLIMPKNQYLHGQWYPWYRVLSSVIGYNYFVLWSVCFYPQVLLNYRRKSTKGLSNDFALLNFMGWTFYSAYLTSMYFDEEIQDMYEERFRNESSTVQSNDVAFSIHAMILSFIYLVQIVYYGKSGYSFPLKPLTWVLVLGMLIPSVMVPILLGLGLLPYSAWLDYFYMLSFFKICCTLTKYSKQVVLNWKRQSTSGWNIWYNFLECTGGSLSMLQIIFDSIDMQDITGITGNMAKLALGLATLFFDAIFFTQHYVLYPSGGQSKDKEGIPSLIRTPSLTKSSSRLHLSILDLSKDVSANQLNLEEVQTKV